MIESVGISSSSLYSHQAEAVDAALDGMNVIVTTATASGKSLCFNLPVLESVLDPLGVGRDSVTPARALFLYPTKALAQDQLRALRKLTSLWLSPSKIAVLDGDTPMKDRASIVREASIVLTNPDMLHVTILPGHKRHVPLLSCLRYIVLDEAHMYHGAFGMHVAMVIRRLRRICSHYRSSPQFLCCSATIASPASLLSQLTGLPADSFHVVSEDGSPCGPKRFVLWNPPDELEPRRVSSIGEVANLFAELVRHGLRTIAFCTTRKLSELVLQYAQEALQAAGQQHLCETVMSYRGGYTPEQRREIEQLLFSDRLRGVAATNALELGVDVGSMDATLHLGFQRSIASLWQQAGRAGRRRKTSLSIYIAWDSPIDQFFLRHPQQLFSLPLEPALLNLANPDILQPHLLCAASELPLKREEDEALFAELPAVYRDNVLQLIEKGNRKIGCLQPVLGGGGGGGEESAMLEECNFCGAPKPSKEVSLRCIDEHRWKILVRGGRREEEEEKDRSCRSIYEGATYMNNGKTFIIRVLDFEKREA
ncbi:hypothetical protein GUITHDRAFT_80398, partial [Guillardia theta CCMP2712]